ncbi:hypothetical protein TD95_001765 [Thielaviopsis punctulata]|uniref:PPPDE domain-containing protein n=1 Tax=Thielaviopsis punctulata TaxID=72032 RepID=A0A0F4Z8Y0_9PEZI|nr:hypothetical protein TD95_001765 [Thielaviopsis punctulata]
MASQQDQQSQESRRSIMSHRSTISLQKTEVTIHVYDLLPPSRLSSALWTFGSSLLHSGVVINGREYAYGGHQKRGMTGVYWTQPKTVPPGGTFRCEILHGFTLASPGEIEAVLKEASQKFHGTSYNILTKNCNHFTAYLVERLTGSPGPSWLNRAASIGLIFPCIVPREWLANVDPDPEDAVCLDRDDAAETETVSTDSALGDDDSVDEHSRMLSSSARC